MRCRKMLGMVLFFLLFVVPVSCSAYSYTPRSSGMVLDTNLKVVGVNVDSPAYSAGIRPGDQVSAVKDNNGNKIATTEIPQFLYEAKNGYTITVNDKDIAMENKRIKKNDNVGVYLIEGTKEDAFKNLYNAMAFNPTLSPYLTIKNVDSNLMYITTEAKVGKDKAHNVGHYVIMTGGSLGIIDMKAAGTFAIGEQEGYTMLKETIDYDVKIGTLFGPRTWSYPSSGMLEREVIQGMYGVDISHDA